MSREAGGDEVGGGQRRRVQGEVEEAGGDDVGGAHGL